MRKSTLLWAATTRVAAVRADVTTKSVDVTGYEEPVHLLMAEVVEPFETLVVKARTPTPPSDSLYGWWAILGISLCTLPGW